MSFEEIMIVCGIKDIGSVERAYSCIGSLQTFGTHWTIKTTVLRKGLKEGYANRNNVGHIFKLILMDDEGTTIQAIIFNEEIARLEDKFSKGKTYLISNGLVSPVKAGYISAHPTLELILNSATHVENLPETIDHGLLPHEPFKINDIRAITAEGQLVDVIGLVVTIEQCKMFSKSRQQMMGARRNLLLTDESNKTLAITLWGDLAMYEGNFIESRDKRVCTVLLTRLKSVFYRGRLTWGTTTSTVLLIDPVDKHINMPETSLKEMEDASNKGFPLANSEIEYAPISISQLIRKDIADFKVTTCYFQAEVLEITNIKNPSYHACNGCKRKVLNPSPPFTCTYCCSTNYVERFILHLVVTDSADQIIVTLFDAAAVILQCSPTEFAQKLSNANHMHTKIQEIESLVGKVFKFYLDVKTARNRSKGNIVAESLVEVYSHSPNDTGFTKATNAYMNDKKMEI